VRRQGRSRADAANHSSNAWRMAGMSAHSLRRRESLMRVIALLYQRGIAVAEGGEREVWLAYTQPNISLTIRYISPGWHGDSLHHGNTDRYRFRAAEFCRRHAASRLGRLVAACSCRSTGAAGLQARSRARHSSASRPADPCACRGWRFGAGNAAGRARAACRSPGSGRAHLPCRHGLLERRRLLLYPCYFDPQCPDDRARPGRCLVGAAEPGTGAA